MNGTDGFGAVNRLGWVKPSELYFCLHCQEKGDERRKKALTIIAFKVINGITKNKIEVENMLRSREQSDDWQCYRRGNKNICIGIGLACGH